MPRRHSLRLRGSWPVFLSGKWRFDSSACLTRHLGKLFSPQFLVRRNFLAGSGCFARRCGDSSHGGIGTPPARESRKYEIPNPKCRKSEESPLLFPLFFIACLILFSRLRPVHPPMRIGTRGPVRYHLQPATKSPFPRSPTSRCRPVQPRKDACPLI